MKEVVADILADGIRLFHCGNLKLRDNNLFHCQGEEGFGRLCHAELVSASLTKRIAKFPRLEERDSVRCLTEQEQSEILRSSSADLLQSNGLPLRMTNVFDSSNKSPHPEQSESLTERTGQFPSPMEEGVGERVLSFAKIKTLKHIIKKCAFTLAEVLITLGIIGVVAAITIPNLITDYKAKILRSQFQRAYARVEQVHREMVAADEYLPFSLQDNNYYREYPSLIASHLAGAKAPKAGDWGNGTIQNYFKKLGYGDMNGNIGSHLLWYIDDGYVELPSSEIWWIENGTGQQAITVDINGYNNKPNRWGYDLFTFFYDEEKDAYIPDYHGNCDNLRNLSISNYNGRSCASKAANDPNYFKKLLRKQKL